MYKGASELTGYTGATPVDDDPRALIRGDKMPGDVTSTWDVTANDKRDLRAGMRSKVDQIAHGILPQGVLDAIGIPTPSPTPKNFAGTVGSIGTDIGMAAGPVGAASKGLMLINALRSTGKFAPAIADVIANASYNVATAPENKLEAGGMGAGGTLASHALVSFMRNFLPRASDRVLDAAREVGSTPTIGQAAGASADTVGNRMLQEAEHLARNIPVVGSMVGRAQEHSRSGLNTLIKNAAIDAEEGVSNKVRSKLVKTMQARMGRLEDEGLKQVGAAAALAGTVFATPATAAIAATLIAGYTKPVQVALLQLMRGNDYLVMHLHKNPEAMTQLANVAARMATSTQDK